MTYGLTSHAIERYVERVKPALGFAAAENELARLLINASCQTEPPEFTSPNGHRGYYAILSDGIVAAVALNGDVTTILVRGGSSAERRQRRNHHKQVRRAAKKTRRKGPRGHGTGRPPVEEEAWPT